MEIQIQCPCGQPYEFNVEPVNGRMPVAIQCPSCGADGTALADQAIALRLSQADTAPSANLGAESESNRSPTPMAPLLTTPEGPFAQRPGPVQPDAAANERPIAGIIGVVAGGLVGMIGWYGLLKATGYEIGYAAWGVGVLTGWGGRKFVRQGSNFLGVLAGACALLAILGGQYLVVKSQVDDYAENLIASAYQSRMSFAGDALKARSDEEFRALLNRQKVSESQKIKPANVSDEELAQSQRDELPKLEALSKGRPSESEFKSNLRNLFNAQVDRTALLKGSLSFFTLLWLSWVWARPIS